MEKGDADEIVGKLEAALFRSDAAVVEKTLARHDQSLAEGMEIRCRAGLDFYPPGGRLQLVVREVDPVFSLGHLARRRRETLAWLEAEGILDANRSLVFPTLPLRIALVTSHDSAAYHDFLSTLRESAYRFEVHTLHSSVQGKSAEREIVSALRMAARLPVDCVVVTRGGGSRTDLAAFDSRSIAEAIARSPIPVVTGLGHQIDESVADRVAHTALKTPTKAAEHLVGTVSEAEETVELLASRLADRARDRLRRGREKVGRAERGLGTVRFRLRRERDRVEEAARVLGFLARERLDRSRDRIGALVGRLTRSAPRVPRRLRRERRRLARRLVREGRRSLVRSVERVEGYERLCRQLAPARVLERGFSVTRTVDGVLVRGPEEAPEGTRLVTTTARGEIRSKVEGP